MQQRLSHPRYCIILVNIIVKCYSSHLADRYIAMHKTGVLLINLGTPSRSSAWAVYRYLASFLYDNHVINIPWLARFLLIHGMIIPARLKKTTAAYRKIWSPEGPPLLLHTENLKKALSKRLGEPFQVEIAMRYGKPAIDVVLQKMQHCEQIIVVPLFPQYAFATTGSALHACLQKISQQTTMPNITAIASFYDHPGFIAAYAKRIQETINTRKIDLLLFSYHGLPEKHITQSGCTASCDHQKACPKIDITNHYCYRAQCYTTSRLLASALALNPDQYAVAFQSRLGRLPWIKPYIDQWLPSLRQKNIKNIAIACPSFVTDCLETLEEINIRLRTQWQRLGGNEFIFIPSLNDDATWVEALANICEKQIPLFQKALLHK